MSRAWAIAALVALVVPLAACLDDFDVESMTFPCREDLDCVEGYECDHVRWVCVEEGTAGADAGVVDAGTSTTSDAG